MKAGVTHTFEVPSAGVRCNRVLKPELGRSHQGTQRALGQSSYRVPEATSRLMRRAQTSWLDCGHQFIQAIGFLVAVPAARVSSQVSLFSQAAHSCPCSVSAITDSSTLTNCISQLVSGGQSHGLTCWKILVLLTGVAFSLPVAQFRRLSPHVLLPISVCFSAPPED